MGIPIEVSLRGEGSGRPQGVTRPQAKECWSPGQEDLPGRSPRRQHLAHTLPFPSRPGIEHISVVFQTLAVWPIECACERLHTAVPPDICLESSQVDRCVRAAAPGSDPPQGPREKMLHWKPVVPRVKCHLSDKSQVSQEPAPL